MTDTSLSHLPMMAGSAVASSAGRAGLWTLAQYRRAPLAITAVIAMTALSLAGAAHALYFEHGRHPAPLFAPEAATPAAARPHHTPPTPAHARPDKADRISNLISTETTGSVTQAPPKADIAPVIGNDDVAEMQKKLAQLDFFKGTVDGYYGPKTADAIRAFESRNGMKPVGSLDPEVMQAIRNAPLQPASPQPTATAAAPIPMPAPAPEGSANLVSGDAAEASPPATPDVDHVMTASLSAESGPDLHPRRLALGPQRPASTATSPVTSQTLPAPAPRMAPAAPAEAESAAAATRQVAAAQPDVKLGPVKSPTTRFLDAAGQTAAGAFDAVASAVEDMTSDRDPTASARIGASADRPALTATIPGPAAQPSNPAADSTNPVLVAKVQRGLASLGFLVGQTNGVADEATAKAIRNFEVYYDYPVTGRVTPQLLNLLQQAGAQT